MMVTYQKNKDKMSHWIIELQVFLLYFIHKPTPHTEKIKYVYLELQMPCYIVMHPFSLVINQ